MNNKREPYILYPYVGVVPEGYTLIHKYTFRDDSLKKKCSIFSESKKYHIEKSARIKADSQQTEESYKFYLIKTCDMQKFFDLIRDAENKHLKDINNIYRMQVEDEEQLVTANDTLPRLTYSKMERLAVAERSKRYPKIKYMRTQPLS
jgi:hypothetical protein